jgi:hypothetical protein
MIHSAQFASFFSWTASQFVECVFRILKAARKPEIFMEIAAPWFFVVACNAVMLRKLLSVKSVQNGFRHTLKIRDQNDVLELKFERMSGEVAI